MTIHGMCNTSTYHTWENMKSRCQNQNYRQYKDYGGRGITICPEWNDFTVFLKDMGEKPTPRHTLERRNNMAGYTPKNCFWATRLTQANNTRHLCFFIAYGPCGQIEIAKNQSAFARKWGLQQSGISQYIGGHRNYHKGWTFERLEKKI